MDNPPSFEPRRKGARPSAQGAKKIGQGEEAANPRARLRSSVPPRQAYTPARPAPRAQTPRSYAPLNQAQHPQEPRSEMPRSYAPRRQSIMPAQRIPAQQARILAQQTSISPHPRKQRKSHKRAIVSTLVIILIIAIAVPIMWVSHLYRIGNEGLTHVAALSGRPDTPGTTYLIVGSDQRDAAVADGTGGMRSDTIMLLHKPESGVTALISLPRDIWVTVPENGEAKLNAAFSWGGQPLLVQTVEELTGLTIDHYVQIGMYGVRELTQAVNGITLCLDYDVDDPNSGLVWEAGCHEAWGDQALAFSRMRYSDPYGDLGRTQRQRQVVSAILHKALSREILLSPSKQEQLVRGTASVLTVDDSDSIMDVGFAGLALLDVMSGDAEKGISGAPPIATINGWQSGQSVVELDAEKIDTFWQKLGNGSLNQSDFYDPTQ